MTPPVEHLERFVGTWEPSLAQEFFQYDHLLRAKSHRPSAAWGQTGVEPYWKELPRWLAKRKGNGPRALSPKFLDIVLWGQTALFYAVRLQDDLLDGALSRSPLMLAPLLFMTEAHRAYSSVIDVNADFWKHYRLAIETTVSGIVRVASLQRDPAARATELLQCYGCVDAIFSVGAVAICEQMGMAEVIPRISRFVSELGKVLLALDDADDIEEDLADGRLNYPARILLKGRIASGTVFRPLAKTWRPNACATGYDEIKKALLRCLSRAASAIAPLELQPAMDLIGTTRAVVQDLRLRMPSGDSTKRREVDRSHGRVLPGNQVRESGVVLRRSKCRY